MKISTDIKIEEGDVLVFNDEYWKVKDYVSQSGGFDVQSVTGNIDNFSREEIEEYINTSGKFSIIKEDYIEIF